MKLPRLYPRDPLPIYAQLERAIRTMILTGELKAGEQLPTVRQLAVDLKINANTVAKVYAELERTGAIETRRGVGSFVSERSGDADASPEADRVRELHRILSPTLAELHSHGFSLGEVIEYLKRLS
jgi:GntR family transcriptional regulator